MKLKKCILRKRIKEKVIGKKDVSLFTIANLFRRATNFIFVVLLARILDLEMFGEYTSYAYTISLFIVITNFGFNEFILANSKNEESLKFNYTGFFLLSFVILIAFFLGAYFFEIPNYYLFILVGTKIFLDTSLVKILLSYFQVIKKVDKLTISYLVSSFVILIFLFIAYFLKSGIYTFLIIYCSGLSLIYIIPLSIANPFTKISFRKFFVNNLLKVKYYGLSYVTVSMYMLIPNVLAAQVIGREELGIYQVAYSIANVILLVSISFIQYSYGKFLRIENRELFQKQLKNTINQVSIINIVVILFLLFFGKFILIEIYGSGVFEQSWSLLMILLVANLFQSISAILLLPLIVFKEQKVKFHINIELIVLSLISSFLLITNFESLGITYSFLVVFVYSFFRLLKINRKILSNYEWYYNKNC